MEGIFLGTGAAEGVPAAYCRCATCEGVRERGGREIKTRSSFRLGETYQIDVSPDQHVQMLRLGLDMYDIEHLLITHTHGDHFALSGVTDRTMAATTNGKPLHVYTSRPAARYLERLLQIAGVSAKDRESSLFSITEFEYFSEYRVGDLTVETVKGNHTAHGDEEYAINYLITTPEGGRLLYALDTGFYRDETWEYLQGRSVDVVIMDCTFAGRTDRDEFSAGHLALNGFLKMLEQMTEIGFVTKKTRVYASHVNPHQGLRHDEIQTALDTSRYAATVAYDGLRITV